MSKGGRPLKRLILLLGGARSGKSAFAVKLAQGMGERVLFVATATAEDEEMKRRIQAHRSARPRTWRTLEAPSGLAQALAPELRDAQVVIVDCLTLLASNLISPTGDAAKAAPHLENEVELLLQLCRSSAASFIIVSNEVGMGLVPNYPSGRLFRDLLGKQKKVKGRVKTMNIGSHRITVEQLA
ncbi:MAG: bifunctional adenosylcobinamide kinase/adenosylcobinamide-phosphate guanylyltransferase [Chloroflexota bacterium]|nr:bifunctional adenosylcobinamide kinase/adenosylcobinamide-phosphate guanylyltransferase [Chloroflexota bacterium]